MPWTPFVDEAGGAEPQGSEGGIVLLDEEHALGARITLERDSRVAPYAITCGIYGWMLHTRFFRDGDVARGDYEAMKAGLSRIMSLIPLETDPDLDERLVLVTRAIGKFVDRYPT